MNGHKSAGPDEAEVDNFEVDSDKGAKTNVRCVHAATPCLFWESTSAALDSGQERDAPL